MITDEELARIRSRASPRSVEGRLAKELQETRIRLADATAHYQKAAERCEGLEEFNEATGAKPSVLVVQELGKYGDVSLYGSQEIKFHSLTIWPWQDTAAEIKRLGKMWWEKYDHPAGPDSYVASPIRDELSALRAIELEHKRADMQAIKEVAQMKEAISDAIPIIREWAMTWAPHSRSSELVPATTSSR